MSKLIKKYQSFLEDVYAAQPARKEEQETITRPTTKPGEREGMPQRGDKKYDPIKIDEPSVRPDPLAVLKDKLEGSEFSDDKNTLYYKDYEIEYPSGPDCYVVNKVKLTTDPKSVVDYINNRENKKETDYYNAEYDKTELSDVTVGEDGKLNNFDAEYEALKGKTHLKESKSYKETKNFKKRK